jgi:hypothetical protein
MVLPLMHAFRSIISYFGAKGKGLYIPPTHDYKDCILIVPKNINADIDRLQIVNHGSKSLVTKDGIILNPPGSGLLRLVEKELTTSISSKELNLLGDVLNDSLVEILKIAENVYSDMVGNKIFVQVFNSIFFDSCARVHVELPEICTQVCCPICSLIACIIAKMTKRYVNIEETQINPRERSINTSFRLSKIHSY